MTLAGYRDVDIRSVPRYLRRSRYVVFVQSTDWYTVEVAGWNEYEDAQVKITDLGDDLVSIKVSLSQQY